MRFFSSGLLRAGAVSLAASLLLGGCGAFLAVRTARRVVTDRNEQLQAQREATWLALWPVLKARCTERGAAQPAVAGLPLKQPQVTLVFDTRGLADQDDAALIPPSRLLNQLVLARGSRSALPPGEQGNADFTVNWQREPLRSDWPEILTAMEVLTLRVSERGGRVLAQDPHVALQWLGALQPEYLSCHDLLRDSERHPEGQKAPDFLLLKEVFGVKPSPLARPAKGAASAPVAAASASG